MISSYLANILMLLQMLFGGNYGTLIMNLRTKTQRCKIQRNVLLETFKALVSIPFGGNIMK